MQPYITYFVHREVLEWPLAEYTQICIVACIVSLSLSSKYIILHYVNYKILIRNIMHEIRMQERSHLESISAFRSFIVE